MFMREHPGEWMGRREVTQGMKQPAEQENANGASLRRLAISGRLEKGKRKFRFPPQSGREVRHP